MRRVERCPACECVRIHVATQADSAAMARYLSWSARKYGGLMDSWVDADHLAILGCDECGHHWYRDQPSTDQLSAMYATGRPLRGGIALSREPNSSMLKEMDRLHRLVGGGMPSLLDYGSGFGRWARAAVQAGFEVHAFEPSQQRGAEEDTPFNLVHEIDALRGRTFDVINLEQVMEHVHDPHEVLTSVQAFCHDKTLIRVTVPDIRRCDEGRNIWREWPFNGERAHVMAPFEHLHGFTPESLRRVVTRAGFSPLSVTKVLWYYPASAARWWLGRWISTIDQTFLLARLSRA